MRHTKSILWICSALLLALGVAGADAFEIGLSSLITKPIHENVTWTAVECLASNPDALPAECLLQQGKVHEASESKVENVALGAHFGVVERKALLKAVWWSDDPNRRLGHPVALLGGLLTLLNWCERHVRDLKSEFLCSSHLGPMQFFHAMAANKNENYDDTRTKILSWSRFAYEIATKRLSLDTNYCAYFKDAARNETAPDHLFAKAMMPADGETSAVCTGSDGSPAWTLQTFFGWDCPNLISAGKCNQIKDGEMALRLAALGAVLHVVQDSFSNSHTKRGRCDNDDHPNCPSAAVSCAPISQFYDYAMQDYMRHRESDEEPSFKDDCRKLDPAVNVHDPVTATATILWHVAHDSDPGTVVKYLSDHVFAKPGEIQSAGSGFCYPKIRPGNAPLCPSDPKPLTKPHSIY